MRTAGTGVRLDVAYNHAAPAYAWKLNVLFLLALAKNPDNTQSYRTNFCIEVYVAVYCRSSILAGAFRLL